MNPPARVELAPVQAQERPMNLTLRIPAEAVPMLPATILQLGDILIRHGRQNDLVSLNLMRAGHAFMAYVVENVNQPFDDLSREGIVKIQAIAKVLQNPHGQGMLKDPWLVDNTATWERSTVEEYCRFAARFEDKNIQVAPHAFAKEVIDWIHALPVDIALPEAPVNNLVANPIGPKELLEYKCYKANESLFNQTQTVKHKLIEYERQLGQIHQLEHLNQALEEENIVIFARFEQVLVRQEESQLQQTAELKRGLEALQVQQQATVTHYIAANDTAQAALSKVKSHLDEARIELNRQQAQIYSLSVQLQGCYGQLGHLQNELNNQDSCSVM